MLLGLLSQNVTVESVLSLDFTRSGKSESFFGTGVRLDLWHSYFIFSYLIYNGNALYLWRYSFSLFSLAAAASVGFAAGFLVVPFLGDNWMVIRLPSSIGI